MSALSAITRYRSRFIQGSFAHNVLVMFTGTTLGQCGAILLAPFLTRLYSPDMFGILGIFTASIAILSVISALRYEMALPLTQSSEDAGNLLAVCISSLITTTLIGCAIVGALSIWDPKAFGLVNPYRWLLPLGFFCIGAYQVMIYVATRQGAFHVIARTKVYQGTLGPLSQVGMGLAGMGVWGLIIGFIIGQSTGVTRLFTQLVYSTRALSHVTLAGMKTMAVRFRRFPLLSSWSGILEAAGGSYILLVAIPLLYSSTIGGFIFLTDRIIGRPLLLISTSILQVYVGDMSKSIHSEDAKHIQTRFLQLAGHQFVIVGSWLLLVNFLAPPLFAPIFGDGWEAAVPYLHILSITYLPQMVMHALLHTLQIMERQGLSALWEIGRFIAVLGSFVVSAAMGFTALEALLLYSIVQATSQVVLFILMYSSIQTFRKDHSHA